MAHQLRRRRRRGQDADGAVALLERAVGDEAVQMHVQFVGVAGTSDAAGRVDVTSESPVNEAGLGLT